MSHLKNIVFSISNMNEMVARMLEPSLGPSAYHNNYGPAIIQTVERLLHPDYQSTPFPIEELLHYPGVDVSLSETVGGELTSSLSRTLNSSFGGRIGLHLFSVTMISPGELLVEDNGPMPEEVKERGDLGSQIRETVERDIEEGHWVPERLRNFAGLA